MFASFPICATPCSSHPTSSLQLQECQLDLLAMPSVRFRKTINTLDHRWGWGVKLEIGGANDLEDSGGTHLSFWETCGTLERLEVVYD